MQVKSIAECSKGLNAGQKYCRMLQGEHSALLLTYIKLQFVYFWGAVLHKFYWTCLAEEKIWDFFGCASFSVRAIWSGT